MSEGIIERCLLYYSGLIHPVYEQYKLKNDAKYAIQRFCSLGLLSEYSIRPAVSDYDLHERGALLGSDSLEKLTEAMIERKNECQKMTVLRKLRMINSEQCVNVLIGCINLFCHSIQNFFIA